MYCYQLKEWECYIFLRSEYKVYKCTYSYCTCYSAEYINLAQYSTEEKDK